MKTTRRISTAFLALFFITSANAQQRFTFGTSTNPSNSRIEVDSKGFVIDGRHVLPVMGEMHYARVPKEEWRREIRKMKAGGITILATYVFWIHHEEREGVFDWSGNKSLRDFLQTCNEEQMPVVLRIGPFSHGEVYQGGFPVWLTDKVKADPKNYKLRSLSPGFMEATERLFRNIYAQVGGQLWKDGGPVIGIQIENECRGPWAYYKKLKEIAVSIGFDVPFYTRTGWPKLTDKEEFGQMLPLYGDYADGFWDRSLKDMPGEYAKAFTMKDTRISGVIATETFGTNQDTKMEAKELQYPYLTCELGGGMTPSYHRRINMSGREPLPLAICKVGSGSNLPGYYMYHGGSNPYSPLHSMAEMQQSATTAHNDMPHISYEFQAPLGEMGQVNAEAFHSTRLFHQFLAEWGEELSQMDVDTLSEHYSRRGCFEFYNDYVRILNEQGRCYVRPVGMSFNGHTISANAQPFCKIGNCLYLIEISGMKPTITIDGKRQTLKTGKALRFHDIEVVLLSQSKACTAFVIDGCLHFAPNGGVLYKDDNGQIVEETWTTIEPTVTYTLKQQAGPARQIKMGAAKVAEQPSDADFDSAAIYTVTLNDTTDAAHKLLYIDYAADCARVYADGILVQDNFWNGKPMAVRMSDLVGKQVELRILPLRHDAPIYLQKDQRELLDKEPGDVLLRLNAINVVKRTTKSL